MVAQFTRTRWLHQNTGKEEWPLLDQNLVPRALSSVLRGLPARPARPPTRNIILGSRWFPIGSLCGGESSQGVHSWCAPALCCKNTTYLFTCRTLTQHIGDGPAFANVWMLKYEVRAVGFARRRLCSQVEGGARGSEKGKITGEQGQQSLAVSPDLSCYIFSKEWFQEKTQVPCLVLQTPRSSTAKWCRIDGGIEYGGNGRIEGRIEDGKMLSGKHPS